MSNWATVNAGLINGLISNLKSLICNAIQCKIDWCYKELGGGMDYWQGFDKIQVDNSSSLCEI